mgnify:CR=1 FL=1
MLAWGRRQGWGIRVCGEEGASSRHDPSTAYVGSVKTIKLHPVPAFYVDEMCIDCIYMRRVQVANEMAPFVFEHFGWVGWVLLIRVGLWTSPVIMSAQPSGFVTHSSCHLFS